MILGVVNRFDIRGPGRSVVHRCVAGVGHASNSGSLNA